MQLGEQTASSLPRPAEPRVPWREAWGCWGWEMRVEGERGGNQPPDGRCPQGCRWCPSAGARCSAPRRTPRSSARWPVCSHSSCRPSGPLARQPAPPGAAGTCRGWSVGPEGAPPDSPTRERLEQQHGFYISTVINLFLRALCSARLLAGGIALAACSPAGLAAAAELFEGAVSPRGAGARRCLLTSPWLGKGKHQAALRSPVTSAGCGCSHPALSPQATRAPCASGAQGAPHPRAGEAGLSSGESLPAAVIAEPRFAPRGPSTFRSCKSPATAAPRTRGRAGKEAGGKAGAPRGPGTRGAALAEITTSSLLHIHLLLNWNKTAATVGQLR